MASRLRCYSTAKPK